MKSNATRTKIAEFRLLNLPHNYHYRYDFRYAKCVHGGFQIGFIMNVSGRQIAGHSFPTIPFGSNEMFQLINGDNVISIVQFVKMQ